MVCVDPIVKSALDNLLLGFLQREGQFSRGETFFREPMLRLVAWWEKYIW